jgi:hypothetical protein
VAKQSGLGDRLYVGAYDLSGNIGSIQRIAGGPAALDLTDITQSGYGRVGGLRTGALEFSSWFNPAAGQSHPRLASLPTTDVIATYGRGTTLGNPAASCVAKQIGYDGTRAADGSLSFAVSAQSNAYGIEWGTQLTAGLRTDTAATNGTGVDGAASSAFGAQFYLHLTAFTGTSVVVSIEDSADNVTFAALSGAAFTSTAAITSERIAVTGTVRRYLRVVTTGTITSTTFFVNGVRNTTAVTF